MDFFEVEPAPALSQGLREIALEMKFLGGWTFYIGIKDRSEKFEGPRLKIGSFTHGAGGIPWLFEKSNCSRCYPRESNLHEVAGSSRAGITLRIGTNERIT